MKKTIQVLKSYFTAGYKPTESHFENLIDSLATPMIGEIKTISFSAVPKGWAKCDGQLLNISENEILFSLIGTTYGGDGTTTFALPNLQGKTMIHNDATYGLGSSGGTIENTLSESQLPAHNHDVSEVTASHNLTGTIMVNEEDGESEDPQGRNFGLFTGSHPDFIYNSQSNDKLMAADNVQINGTVSLAGRTTTTGSTTPVNNMQPYLAVNTIIALEGIDPLAN
jgi:microcystin-dependent protein